MEGSDKLIVGLKEINEMAKELKKNKNSTRDENSQGKYMAQVGEGQALS
jgi:hypothetical protein